jgi:PST family polysaccharide transporter
MSYQILMLPINQISGPISSVLVASLSRLVSDSERFRRTYLGALTKLLMMVYPLYAFLVVMAHDIILAILGNKWERAADIFVLLGLGFIVQPVGNSLGWLYYSWGRTGTMFRVGAVVSVVIVLSFGVGLPYGPEGVAAAYSLALVAIAPYIIWAGCRSTPVRPADIYRACLPGLLGAATVVLSAFALRFLAPELGRGLPVALVAAVLAMVAVLIIYLLVPVTRREILDVLRTAASSWSQRGAVPEAAPTATIL